MTEYPIQILSTDGRRETGSASVSDAFDRVHAGEIDVILMTVADPDEIASWWGTHEKLGMNGHKYHPGITTSGMTLGKLQRASEEEYPERSGEYFRSASVVNPQFQKTEYFRFFERELDVRPMVLNGSGQMLIGSQREYPAASEIDFSFAPHSDSIAFARAADSWPIKTVYTQTAAFVTINNAENNAGFVMWDYAPRSRAELDEFYAIYDADNANGLAFLDRNNSIEVHPAAGELCIFNCRKMHGIQRCSSLRRTIGSFFIQDDGWRIFD
ncbi:MAG: hypothetical protein AAF982_03765 [Pseudomonadota bacterium]